MSDKTPDGVIKMLEALRLFGQGLQIYAEKQLQSFQQAEHGSEELRTEEQTEEERRDWHNFYHSLNSTHLKRALGKEGIDSFEKLSAASAREIEAHKGVGKIAIRTLQSALQERGKQQMLL